VIEAQTHHIFVQGFNFLPQTNIYASSLVNQGVSASLISILSKSFSACGYLLRNLSSLSCSMLASSAFTLSANASFSFFSAFL